MPKKVSDPVGNIKKSVQIKLPAECVRHYVQEHAF